jgi:hypothetical protein
MNSLPFLSLSSSREKSFFQNNATFEEKYVSYLIILNNNNNSQNICQNINPKFIRSYKQESISVVLKQVSASLTGIRTPAAWSFPELETAMGAL